MTTVIEDSSVEESSVGTNESPVFQIENMDMVGDDVPERRTCLTCEMHGHANEACTDRRPKEVSETPR